MDIDNTTIFWAAIVLIVLIANVRRHLKTREHQQTLRIALEQGHQLDEKTLASLLADDREMGKMDPARSAKMMEIIGIIGIAIGIALAALGVFLGFNPDSADAFWPLLGTGAMGAIIGLGIYIAGRVSKPSTHSDTTDAKGLD